VCVCVCVEQPADIIRGAAEEVLAALKVDAKKDDVKKKEIEVRAYTHTPFTHSPPVSGCFGRRERQGPVWLG